MDVFKKLKSVFVVEDGTTTSENEDVKTTEKASDEVKSVSTPAPEIKMPEFDAKSLDGKAPDTKFINILLEAIEKANLSGFDYLEYKTSLQSLAKMNMDQATKYQSAMAMAKTMGASKETIVNTANQYLSVLKQENDKFQQAVEAQKSKVATDQSEGLKNIKISIENKKKQIEELKAQIAKEEAQLEKMQSEISNSANKIAETSAKFNQAYVVVTQQIVDDIKNISQYVTN